MKRLLIGIALASLAAPSAAQFLPQPEAANPRLQSVAYVDGREVLLTALPQTGLTVLLEPGEAIRRVSLSDQSALEVRVSAEHDSFLLLPAGEIADLTLLVQTDRRSYPFRVRTGSGLMAAYLVRFTYGEAPLPAERVAAAEPAGEHRPWQIRGDRAVRPAAISDDGVRTYIAFAPDQPLPAVLALGPTGEEEIVNGYMRGDRFVIDRVHRELVFRIDKARAIAQPAPTKGRAR